MKCRHGGAGSAQRLLNLSLPSVQFSWIAVWIFSNVGWEKGNFGKRDIEMGYSPCSAWLSVITS